MENSGWQASIDDISRHHKLQYKIKPVEIGPVIWDPVMVFSASNVQWSNAFSISLENGGRGRRAIIDGISRRHKLSYEIKTVEIDPVVGVGEQSEGFFSPYENVWRSNSVFPIYLGNGGWWASGDN
ncbi:hypothetical protein AVEN_204160-1 [Araneus ventricosus]|uniref:Uncharacterized protein n=1 Tax=Araneus ventricosus TaxID=182803 RepID=A0A4Y2MGX4_ARAVE|nr:hypothetical protein AVEN_204160-1 [Araneus ventricosus]